MFAGIFCVIAAGVVAAVDVAVAVRGFIMFLGVIVVVVAVLVVFIALTVLAYGLSRLWLSLCWCR